MIDKILVQGIAVTAGTSRNNHKFLAEELQKATNDMIGKPILKDHEATVDNSVGKVTSAYYSNVKGGEINYSGFVLDSGMLKDQIESGVISEVSIGAYAEQMLQEDDGDEHSPLIPIGLHFMELSLTPCPAVQGTGIARASMSADVQKINTIMEEDKMEEIKTPVSAIQESPKVDFVAELAKVQEELVKAKIALAKKELETLTVKETVKAESQAVSTAQVKTGVDMSGYVIEKGEYGNMAIRKELPKFNLAEKFGGR